MKKVTNKSSRRVSLKSKAAPRIALNAGESHTFNNDSTFESYKGDIAALAHMLLIEDVDKEVEDAKNNNMANTDESTDVDAASSNETSDAPVVQKPKRKTRKKRVKKTKE
jgi:hypothetical protein